MVRATGSRELILRAALRIFCLRGDGPVSVSELALAAGVARGTIYNQFGDASRLFEQVARALAVELHDTLEKFLREQDEPPLRLARGLMFCLRRAAEDPDWGRFIARFGGSAATLREVWRGRPRDDLMRGFSEGFYDFRESQIEAVISLLSGATIAAIARLTQHDEAKFEGKFEANSADWRGAGTDLAELALRALGVAPAAGAACVARALAEVEAYRPL